MSDIKSARAKKRLEEGYILTNAGAEEAVILAEQDAEDRARKAFANITKKFIGLLPVEALEAEFERSLKEE